MRTSTTSEHSRISSSDSSRCISFVNQLSLSVLLLFIGLSPLASQDIDTHRWEHRLLIIKSATDQHPSYQAQLLEIHNSERGYEERKLLVYHIIGDNYILRSPGKKEMMATGKVSSRIEELIIDTSNDFEVILIGLDGGVKHRTDHLLTTDVLFGIIDVMPMRKAELRRGG